MSNQAKPVYEVDAHVVRLGDVRWSGDVEHRVHGDRQPECERHEAGHFGTQAEAFSAGLDLAKKIEQFP